MKFLQPLSFYAGIRSKLHALLKILAKRSKQRASAFLLEPLEPRVLLSAMPMEVIQALATASTGSAAVVVTDYPDYAPTETAIITTSNTNGEGLIFSAGELVRFQVTRTDGIPDYFSGPVNGTPAGNAPWYVIDGVGGFDAYQEFDANGQAIDRDANGLADWIAPDNDLVVNGSISTAWYVEPQYLGASLQLTAAGQDSGAIATTTFTDANFNTTTTVTSSSSTTIYGTSVTFTARVIAANASTAPQGSVQFFDGATLIGTDSIRNSAGTRRGTWSITTSSLNAGTHSIRAVYGGGAAGADTFNASTSANITQTVAKANATVAVTGYTGLFDGAAHGATGTAVGVLGENLSAGLNLGTTFTNVPGGMANWTFSGGTNYNDQSGTVAIVITNSSLLTTTTGVTSSALTTTYGTAVTFTATVTAASGSAAPTGTVQFFDGTTSLGIVSAPSTTGTGTSTWSRTTANLAAGTHASIRAVYTATGSFAGSTSANLTQTVNRKALTGGFTAGNKTYDGTTTATVQTRTLSGIVGSDAVSLTGGTATFSTASAGTGKTVTLAGATLTGAAAGNYTLSSVGTTTATIAKADATVTVTGYTSVYGASAGTAVGLLSNSLPVPIQSNGTVLELSAAGITNTNSAGLSGVNGFRYVNTVFPADQEAQVTVAGAPAAGSGHFVFVFLRTQNPNTTGLNSYYIAYQENGATGTWLVGRLINNSPQTRAIGSGTLLAAGDQIRADVVGNRVTAYSYHGGVWKTEISFTMTGADIVSGPGYMGLEISGASPEIRLTNMIGGGYTGVFGAPATNRATGTVVGVLGESLSGLDLSGTTHTNAGTYTDPWTFTDVTGNYNNAGGTVINTIAKANATVAVTGYNVTYNGAAHQAIGTVRGVFGEALSGLDLSRTTHTNPGAYTDPWTFADVTGNYENASGTVFNQIVL